MNTDAHNIDFEESGSGPAVLFIPGSFSTPAAWYGIHRLLPKGYRFISTSILGYGSTEETRNLEDFDMQHEVRVIETIAQKINQPVHLVGHSFGGTIALAAALDGKFDVASLTTFEANPLTIINRHKYDKIFSAAKTMSAAFETAYYAQEPDAAARIIDFWGGKGSFTAMPAPVQDYCRTKTFANVLDWHCVYTFKPTKADFTRLTMPTLIVRGGLAVPTMVAITDVLTDQLPDAQLAVVKDARHFLISTHAADCADLLANFYAQKD